MKLTDKQMGRLVRQVLEELEAGNIVTYKVKPEQVAARAHQLVKQDYEREAQLDQDVQKMMDELERQNPGEFQRYKMFPLLKKRVAKERGIIL